MQGVTAEEEEIATEEDSTAVEAADQEQEMMWIEADSGCGAAIREVAAQKQRGDGDTAKETDEHRLLEEAAVGAADGEGGNGRAGMLGGVFFH